MNENDIVCASTIEGLKITAYFGPPIYARESSADKVYANVIKQAENLGANKIVGFQLHWPTPRRFYGSGTAVTMESI